MLHKLAIITVVYQNYTILKDYLKSLENQINKNFRLYIADMSEKREKIETKVPCTVITSANMGYAHGVNLGLKKAMQDDSVQFCIMNNDTYFKKDFTNNVLSSITNHPSSIIGGKIYYASGYEYHKDRYQTNELGKVLWYAGGNVDWDHALTPHRGVDEVDKKQYNRFEPTGFVNGCLMCFDQKVFDQLSYWDEKYFLYFEDADYCVRARILGIPLYYDPSLVIWHKNAQSTGGAGSKIHLKYQEWNRLRFGWKFAPVKTKFHLLKNYFLKKL